MAEGMLLDRVQQLYEHYLDQVREVSRTRKFGDGLFGFGSGTAKHPCHNAFAQELEELLEEFAAQEPASAQVRTMLEFLYCVPQKHKDGQSAYWMMLAVHSMTHPLIALLEPADAGALWELYRKTYPRRMRLPAQEQVLKALDAGRKC